MKINFQRHIGDRYAKGISQSMNKAALFFDIDGTLWNYDHYIPKSTIEAIRKARKNGHLALICSGRSRAFINHPGLLGIGFDGIVCAGGCHIEIDGKVIFEKLLEPEKMIQTIELVRQYGFKPILEGPENLYLDDEEFPVGSGYSDVLRNDMKEKLLSISGEQFGKWKNNKLTCLMEDEEKIESCYEKLRPDFEVIAHNSKACELLPKGFNKATGMLQACKFFGIDSANTYAFGDSENDLQMLEAAGVGVAMGNGTDRAKNAADYVTTAFDEDGIYNALKHFKLI